MAGTRARRRRGERGAAAVEFALVAPLLLYLVLGIITYGWILAFRQSLSQATAEGARAAAVAPGGSTPAQQQTRAIGAVNDSLTTFGVTCDTTGHLIRNGAPVGTCTVTVATCANDATATCVTVALDYHYRTNPLIPLPGLGIVSPDDVSDRAVAQVNV